MRLFLLAVLLVLPAFFAAAEVALLRLRPSRVEVLVEEEQAGARLPEGDAAEGHEEQPERPLIGYGAGAGPARRAGGRVR